MKMKGYKLIVFALLFILYDVKAYSNNLVLDCGNNILEDNKVTCNLILENNDNKINNIELKLETNFKVSYLEEEHFHLNNDNNLISITPENLNMDSNNIKILSFILEKNEESNNGNNEIIIKDILIHDNDNNYSIPTITKKISIMDENNSCSISNIVVDGNVVKDFDVNKHLYDNIYVSKIAVFIDAIKCDAKASITGLGYVVVPKDTTIERIVTVTSNNKRDEYTLVISNKEEIKADVILKETGLLDLVLTSNNKKIDFNFNKEVMAYNVIVSSDINKIKVSGKLSDLSTYVKGYEPRDIVLKDGDNLVEIKVIETDDVIKTYKINIFKEQKLSDENNLESLIINDNQIELIDDVVNYDLVLPNNITSTKIVAVGKDINAKIIYNDISLIDGINLPITITVVAPSGKKREYQINITRLPKEEIKYTIIVGNYPLEFNMNIYSYDLIIDDNKLDIKVDPENLDYEIINNDNLVNGSRVIVNIKVDDEIKSYTLNIYKNNKFDFKCFSIFILGVISLIATIIYVNTKL